LQNGYPKGSFLWVINHIYFQYFSVLITIVSAVVMVVVSHMTAGPNDEQIRSLTFETVTPEDRARTRASWAWPEVAGSVLVLVSILGAYLYFRG
jgi:SSS family solute:Na+ symporter